jgi:hypothetical protein
MKSWLVKSELKIALVVFAILGVVAFFTTESGSNSTKDNADKSNEVAPAIDTLIPKGYVLVPIELTNAEPLGSLIGSTAVVDLYLSSFEKAKAGYKVGSRIKLVRAPLNPQLFAVLVKDLESEKILAQPGPYFAVLQNHQEAGATIQEQASTKSKTTKLEITYQR